MPKSTYKTAITCIVLGCFLSASALAAGNEAAIHKSRELLQAEKFSEALSSASNAVIADPNDYRGYYYKAMAEVGLGHKNEALKAIEVARRLGGASAKAALDKLQNVALQLQGTGSVSSGDKSAAPIQAQSVTSGESENTVPLILKCNIAIVGKGNSEVNVHIYKIHNKKWENWSSDRSTWQGDFCESFSDRDTRWTGKCTIKAGMIEYFSEFVNTLGEYRGSGFWKYAAINRFTGAYEGKGRDFVADPNGGRKTVMESQESGSCEPVADPASSVPKPKF